MEDPLFVDGSIVIYTESKRHVETEPLLFRAPREGDPLKSNKKSVIDFITLSPSPPICFLYSFGEKHECLMF